MAESYGFFDSGINDTRQYTANTFAEYFRSFFTTGVSSGLQISATSGMNVSLAQGFAIIQGYFYKNDGAFAIAIENSDPNLPRIDRIVLKLDLIARTIHAVVKKGNTSSSPFAPSLQRDSNIYEISLAKIYVSAGATTISASNITDERYDLSVCGLASAIVKPVIILNAVQPNLTQGDIWIQYI
ncbi:hypothetical protein M2651_05830 [Clostridium sp. SYSU_GA19001]|uniref:hypothetical protein n=1 Tax=Clostridium caldaquaticum TaxID=2940653 RepID=UPI002077264F|nr:hypothetical protein [Clostridium caldaquaticum]MCM8710545.1 hypothetical protein [Clostridium caldaquaticum]